MSRPARTDNELDKDRLSMLLIKAQDGMTYNEFAEKCEVSSSYLCKCIKKQINSAPSKKILGRIATYTKSKGVTEDDLLEAAGYSLKKSSKDYSAHMNRIKKLSIATIMSALNDKGYTWKPSKNGDEASDFCVDIDTDEFNQWLFRILTIDSESALDGQFRRLLHYCTDLMLLELDSKNIKFSFVTTTRDLFDHLKAIRLPALHMYVSAILINPDTLEIIEEQYIMTHLMPPKAMKSKYVLTTSRKED